MEKLKIDFKNCYGIEDLEFEFDFSDNKNVYVIYAPNGVMKTSFSRTFDDFSKGNNSKDEVYNDKESLRTIVDESNNIIDFNKVFVINPYDRTYKSDAMTVLLVNEELRSIYEALYEDINKGKEKFIEAITPLFKLKRTANITDEIEKTFNNDNFLELLLTLETEIKKDNLINNDIIDYGILFEQKNFDFIKSVKSEIGEYINRYDQLIQDSTYLKKDFNHYNATTVHKQLTDNGFFKAEHSINLNNNGDKTEISDQETFSEIIKEEKERILEDEDISKLFEKIDKKVSNAQLRTLREYLFENQEIITELGEPEEFKRKVVLSFIFEKIIEYTEIIDIYRTNKEKIREVVETAKEEKTDWEKVLDIFNRRFYVPYNIEIENKDETVLQDVAPSIKYNYHGNKPIDEDVLIKILSQGERRTLYLLNIIFEIESRKKKGTENLIIVDDIADSFDYKNKYAIIEYLKDICNYHDFYMIILTHNYDFFRTIQDRIGMNRYMCSYIAERDEGNIKLEKLKYSYIANPFIFWKKNLDNASKLIASIPFTRNLSEYTGNNSIFSDLTSVLHIKENSENITVGKIKEIYESFFNDIEFKFDLDDNKNIQDIICETAEVYVNSDDSSGFCLEKKIVLSMAIRIFAEDFMINKIDDRDFVSRIKKNQTGKLFKEFKRKFVDDNENTKILERVNLMTPENIHVNSFMFEPIIDMSDKHLCVLYNDVKAITS